MAKVFAPNINLEVLYPGAEMGGALFEIKELLVSAGWSVVGSSDGSSFEFNGTTGGAGTGSGGTFDLWDTFTDANGTDRWMLMEQPGGGRQYMFRRRSSTNTANFSMSPGGNFIGAGASASVPPTASDQRFIWQTTTTSDSDTYTDNSDGYFNVWARDDAVNGEYAWGFFTVDGANGTDIDYACGVVPVDNADPSDTEPLAFYHSTTSDITWQAVNANTSNFEASLDNVDGYSGFGPGQAAARPGQGGGGEDLASPVYLSNTTPEAFIKGTVNTEFVVMKGANRNYPDLFKVGTAPNEVYYVYSANLSFLMPWDDAGTVPLL